MLTEKYLPVHTGYRRNSDSLRSNRDPRHNGLMIPIEIKIPPKLAIYIYFRSKKGERKKIFPIDTIFLITNLNEFPLFSFFFLLLRDRILYNENREREREKICSIVRIKRSSRRNWTTRSRTSLSLSLSI